MARLRLGERRGMQLPKEKILDLLRSRGEDDKASKADSELPDHVDTQKHAGILDKLGIDPEMTGKLGAAGGIGKKLGL